MASLDRAISPPSRARPSLAISADEWLMRGLILLCGAWLTVFVLLPLLGVVIRSFQDTKGNFIGLSNYITYFATPNLSVSLINSVYIAGMSTAITLILAFIFAYALTRTCMPGKAVLRTLALLPLYAPSLLHAIAFIYLFGTKGVVTTGFFGFFQQQFGVDLSYNMGLYKGPTGIILAEVFYLFPHALIILMVSLSLADARLYEAALALGTPPWRAFLTVTLPGVQYGLISAAFVCFTLVITDFGIPKVIGTGFPVLATDIYKQVIGQQNMVMGSTVSILLIAPTAFGFVVDRFAQRKQVALLTSRAVPLQPRPNLLLDRLMMVVCSGVALAIVIVIGTALLASVINVWPYNLTLSFRHYDFEKVAGGGLTPYLNSVQMAFLTAIFGTIIVFGSAYLVEKGKGWDNLRAALYFLASLPVAVPGLVLGLAYIFFFNHPRNPFNFIYGTMAILVLSTIVHFFTVSFYTATAALKQIDREFEAVSASLVVPWYTTFWRVTVPVTLPAILEIAMYLFVNALTTVSAVIFLYAANLQLAAVAIVSMDDAGDTAPAAAMSMLIFFTGIGVRLLYELVTRRLRQRTQAWRLR